nr:hypothetical protein LZ31DRAFT_555526 [Colletotrichum somersetense]
MRSPKTRGGRLEKPKLTKKYLGPAPGWCRRGGTDGDSTSRRRQRRKQGEAKPCGSGLCQFSIETTRLLAALQVAVEGGVPEAAQQALALALALAWAASIDDLLDAACRAQSQEGMTYIHEQAYPPSIRPCRTQAHKHTSTQAHARARRRGADADADARTVLGTASGNPTLPYAIFRPKPKQQWNSSSPKTPERGKRSETERDDLGWTRWTLQCLVYTAQTAFRAHRHNLTQRLEETQDGWQAIPFSDCLLRVSLI